VREEIKETLGSDLECSECRKQNLLNRREKENKRKKTAKQSLTTKNHWMGSSPPVIFVVRLTRERKNILGRKKTVGREIVIGSKICAASDGIVIFFYLVKL